MDYIKLAQRTIAMLSSMIESGECHTTRSKEMKDNAVNGLEQLRLHSVSNWHFLPALHEVNVEVLIAFKYDKKPIQGYWNGKKWIGSFEARYYMNDGFVRDETLNVPEYIYAWTELPDCPEVPTPF